MEKTPLLSLNISTAPYPEFIRSITQKAAAGESDYACVANVHMLVEAYKNSSFAQLVNGAGIVTPDGKPIVWALRFLHGIRQDRVDGMGLLPNLIGSAEEAGVPVFFYGGNQSTLDKTAAHLQKTHPRLQIAGLHSPPFRQLTNKEEALVIEKINGSGAKLVFVVLGCPKQETWMASMKGRVNAFMVGVGGSLPVLIGEQKRAPRWMQTGGLEWLFRLAQEPKRLFKRYAVTNSVFLYLFAKAYLRKKFSARPASQLV